MTVHCWGENPNGVWSLVLRDNDSVRRNNTGTLNSWGLTFYGTAEPPGNEESSSNPNSIKGFEDGAHVAPMEEIASIMADENVLRNSITINEINSNEKADTEEHLVPSLGNDDTLENILRRWKDLQTKQRSYPQTYYKTNTKKYEPSYYRNVNDRLNNYGHNYNDYKSVQKSYRKNYRKSYDDIDALTNNDIDNIIKDIQAYLEN